MGNPTLSMGITVDVDAYTTAAIDDMLEQYIPTKVSDLRNDAGYIQRVVAPIAEIDKDG
jgi:hypothetical protein